MLPHAFGNAGPRCRIAVTVPAGPRRIVDGGERPRFYAACAGKPSGSLAGLQPFELRQCREILVVKLDFIGDWVLTTPFLRNLRLNAPQARITAVVLDRVYELAAAASALDRVVSVSRAEHRRLVFGAADLPSLTAFRDTYLGRRFDLAVVPRWDADFNGALQIAYGSRAPHIVGFSERSTMRKRHLNRGDDRFYTQAIVDPRQVHEGDRDSALIGAMKGRIYDCPAAIDFSRRDCRVAGDFLDAAFGTGKSGFLAVAPYGSEPQKTLPADRLVRTLRRLMEAGNIGIVVIGGSRDEGAARDFAHSLGKRSVSAAGLLGVRESAALIARASAFIGMDSGPAHIAAAVGTPTAVLFCHPASGAADHTRAPQRFSPRGPSGNVLVIQPEVAMAPCIEGCEADEAHCILGLTEKVLFRRLRSFVEDALTR